MEKITLSIEEIIKATQAIDMLLKHPGIAYQKAYWLDRTRKHLIPQVKRWEKLSRPIFEKYAQVIPTQPFIPPKDYQKFKKEVMDIAETSPKTVADVFEKYEMKSNMAGRTFIPAEEKENYEQDMNTEAEKFTAEIEFNMIETDQRFLAALEGIPGELQLALSFMLSMEAEPKLVVSGKGIIFN